jgi:excisionase family DNA binding protein
MEQLIILDNKQFQEIRDDIKAIKEALFQQGKISIPKKWMTASQVADYLGISIRTVYLYESNNTLTAYKNGGKLYFDYEQVESLPKKIK